MKLSYWELNSYFSNIDIAIIGSGIVGLFAAIELKKKSPKLKIIILERGFLPSGASTKNAGFACFGSPSELLSDISTSSENKVLQLVEKRYLGLKKLRETIGDKQLDYQPWGGYELFDQDAKFNTCADKLPYLNKLVKPITNCKTTYTNVNSAIQKFGFNGIKHMVFNSEEGQIDSGKMMHALVLKAQKAGIIILNGIKCKSVSVSETKLILEEDLELKPKKIIICTNGFAKELLPELAVVPARAQVLLTNEITNLKIKGTFHYDEGFYYFRNIGQRILFGGGRNLDFKGETTTTLGITRQIQNQLERMLRDKLLPNVRFSIEQRWSGIMGVGESKTPIVRQLAPNVYCSVRMGGMGIAIGSLVGQEVAELVINS
jgi:gamma-glutamylputrescine oxidase